MEMGKRAARRLIDQINGEPYIKREVLPIEIVERGSVAIVSGRNNSEVLCNY
jgi:DNA-binding LacI/PurR family transcriptional regulator